MPDHKHIKVGGTITDVFAHRFVVETADRRILADLGPKGAETFALEVGLEIVVEGEMKPSELKVDKIARKGGTAIAIEHKKKPHHEPHHDHHHHEPADPRAALAAVERAGFAAIGAPRRKPKHFEVLARKDGELIECHVELDGHIRKEKPVASDDHKWSCELAAA